VVCNNFSSQPLGLKERCELLGISFARGEFLVACAREDVIHSRSGRRIDRGQTIPYDPGVQVREAFRLGISLKDTAAMMGMTEDEILAYELPFGKTSAYPPPWSGSPIYNLFPPELIDPIKCFR